MSVLKQPISAQTAFGDYRLTEQIGEGGAGRVYAGTDDVGNQIALKLLTNATADKRRRFKNETAFLGRHTHPNLITVIDSGLGTQAPLIGPFYVMRRYAGSLRDAMKGSLPPDKILAMFAAMLDGVEAAHLLGAVHRDLKPENILIDGAKVAVADFGIASFTAQELLTLVETNPQQRLANFMYAAPEQRRGGGTVDRRADVYALGLMLNELFTGYVPHGTNYRLISETAPDFAYLDEIVAKMVSQNPDSRPSSIARLKEMIEQSKGLHLGRQRLSALQNTVVPEGDIDDPLAFEHPKLVGASWEPTNTLTLTLDRPVNSGWVRALQDMGNYTSVMGRGPETFKFLGNQAIVGAREDEVERIIINFRDWLPRATLVLQHSLKRQAEYNASQERTRIEKLRKQEELRAKVNSAIRI